MYAFTISPAISQTKSAWEYMYVRSIDCSQQFSKGAGTPKLVHSIQDFSASWVTQTEDANSNVNN